jgi:hypothetical protein
MLDDKGYEEEDTCHLRRRIHVYVYMRMLDDMGFFISGP